MNCINDMELRREITKYFIKNIWSLDEESKYGNYFLPMTSSQCGVIIFALSLCELLENNWPMESCNVCDLFPQLQ